MHSISFFPGCQGPRKGTSEIRSDVLHIASGLTLDRGDQQMDVCWSPSPPLSHTHCVGRKLTGGTAEPEKHGREEEVWGGGGIQRVIGSSTVI